MAGGPPSQERVLSYRRVSASCPWCPVRAETPSGGGWELGSWAVRLYMGQTWVGELVVRMVAWGWEVSRCAVGTEWELGSGEEGGQGVAGGEQGAPWDLSAEEGA